MEAHRWRRRSCRSPAGAMTTKNGRRRAGKRAAGMGIASRGSYPTSSSSVWCSQCTSSGWRVAQSSAGIAWPFLEHGDAGFYPPSQASDKGQEDERRTTASRVRWNARPATPIWLTYCRFIRSRVGGRVQKQENRFLMVTSSSGLGILPCAFIKLREKSLIESKTMTTPKKRVEESPAEA